MTKKYHVTLTDRERAELIEIIKKRSEKSLPVIRSCILPAADLNGDKCRTDACISDTYGVGIITVERTRKRFVEEGSDMAVRGKKRDIFKEKVPDGNTDAHLIALRCSEPPSGYSGWTLRLLSDKMVEPEYAAHISHESVRKILKKNELKPWQVKSWIIPEAGADFVCAMEDIPEVYERSYDDKNPVICFDESPRQLIGEKRSLFIDKKGVVHTDYEYIRNGTADLFMICEPLGGRRKVLIKDQHTRPEWAETIRYIAEDMYPDAEKLTLIQDNLSAHKRSALYEIAEPERARTILNRIEFVFTPRHGSWLNIAEIELSVLTRQGLKRRAGNKEELEQRITEWYEERNRNLKTVDWQFRTKDARIKLKRLYPSVKP